MAKDRDKKKKEKEERKKKKGVVIDVTEGGIDDEGAAAAANRKKTRESRIGLPVRNTVMHALGKTGRQSMYAAGGQGSMSFGNFNQSMSRLNLGDDGDQLLQEDGGDFFKDDISIPDSNASSLSTDSDDRREAQQRAEKFKKDKKQLFAGGSQIFQTKNRVKNKLRAVAQIAQAGRMSRAFGQLGGTETGPGPLGTTNNNGEADNTESSQQNPQSQNPLINPFGKLQPNSLLQQLRQAQETNAMPINPESSQAMGTSSINSIDSQSSVTDPDQIQNNSDNEYNELYKDDHLDIHRKDRFKPLTVPHDSPNDPSMYHYSCIAEKGLQKLGIRFIGSEITDVAIGSWSEQNGVEVDDEIIGINEKLFLTDLTEEQRTRWLQRRPIKICFRRPKFRDRYYRLACDVERTGFLINKTTIFHVVDDYSIVGPIGGSIGGSTSNGNGNGNSYQTSTYNPSSSSWASRNGICRGDQLLEINGLLVQGLNGTELCEMFKFGKRPLQLLFKRPSEMHIDVWALEEASLSPDIEKTAVNRWNAAQVNIKSRQYIEETAVNRWNAAYTTHQSSLDQQISYWFNSILNVLPLPENIANLTTLCQNCNGNNLDTPTNQVRLSMNSGGGTLVGNYSNRGGGRFNHTGELGGRETM